MIFLEIVWLWTLLVPLAIVNATAREQFISLKLGDHAEHIIRSIILSSLIFIEWRFKAITNA